MGTPRELSQARASGTPAGSAREAKAGPAELPRVFLDTRMPPAPAPGARVILVGPPEASGGAAGLSIPFAAVLIVLAAMSVAVALRRRRKAD